MTDSPALAADKAWMPVIIPVKNKALQWNEWETVGKREYLVKGVLDAKGMSVVYGESNCGKTFAALDIAFHIALGREWFGKKVKQGGVLYVAAEGGMGLSYRRNAFCLHHDIKQAVPLYLMPYGLDLCHADADTADIIREAKANGAKVIILDTLSRLLAGGNENAPDHMGAFIRNCDKIKAETGAHVMIVHHAGKDASKGGRGHSSLRAAVDTEIEIVKSDEGLVTAEIKKQRDGETNNKFHFTLGVVEVGTDEDGDKITSCVVSPTSEPEKRTKLEGYNKAAYDILVNLVGTFDHVPLDEWTEALKEDFTASGTSGDTVKKRITRIKKALSNDGIIKIKSDNVYLVGT